mmetsp:Transcript_172/g.1286  ORF Transcript_172/g.1286 Transcript_172/m.1286 type:complete len:329 (+) Transcript_172:264-1250(+)
MVDDECMEVRLAPPPNAREEWKKRCEREKDVDVPSTSSYEWKERRVVPPVAQRVSQWDANKLDEELLDLLRAQATRAWPSLSESAASAGLEFLFYMCSVGRGQPTPGMQLLNVRHAPTRSTDDEPLSISSRAALVLAGTLRRAFATRCTKFQRVETFFRTLELLQRLAFFGGARHRSLVERLAGAELRQVRSDVGRAVSFEYLNRSLAWRELSSFLLFLAPLVDATAKRVVRATRSFKTNQGRRIGGAGPSTRVGGDGKNLDDEAYDLVVCPICGYEDPPVKYQALPCQHSYCYGCLMGSCIQSGSEPFACFICGETVTAMQRYLQVS